MSLKDFLAKQPIGVIVATEITEQRVLLPVAVDPDPFYKSFKSDIESETLTAEKALYIGSLHTQAPYQDASALLNSKVTY